MGLNFAIYESVKSFSESPFFEFNLKEKYLNKNKVSLSISSSLIIEKEKDQVKGKETESALAAVFRKGLCGAVAGGTSKFIVYPLVRWSTHVIRKSALSVYLKCFPIFR